MVHAFRPFVRLSEALGSRYGALLVVLVVILVVYSFAASSIVMIWILDLMVLATLGLGLRATSGRRTAYIVMLTLGIAAVVAGTLGGSFSINAAYPVGTGLRAMFLGALLWMILGDIVSRDRVTMDSVFGASCVYLLLGLTWGSLYALIEWFDPTAFGDLPTPGSVSTAQRAAEGDLMYFSMITLTTVGYGDMVPRTPPARTLAAVEGLIAQLFLAIVIARFVALEITARRAP